VQLSTVLHKLNVAYFVNAFIVCPVRFRLKYESKFCVILVTQDDELYANYDVPSNLPIHDPDEIYANTGSQRFELPVHEDNQVCDDETAVKTAATADDAIYSNYSDFFQQQQSDQPHYESEDAQPQQHRDGGNDEDDIDDQGLYVNVALPGRQNPTHRF
jgi:hypothetical protein